MRRSGVVIAGGRSRRMGGVDKRFLLLEGKPLLLRVIERLRPLVDEVLVVTRQPEARIAEWDVRQVVDRYPGHGVLAGVHAGLAAAHGAWAVVVSADLPFLSCPLLEGLLRRAESGVADVVIPRRGAGLEPLHALYRAATCAPAAEQAILRGERRIIAFFPFVRVDEVMPETWRRWDAEGRSFFNVNRPQEWAQAVAMATPRGADDGGACRDVSDGQ